MSPSSGSGRSRAGRILPRGFYERPVREVARHLLGALLIRILPGADGRPRRLAGRIVEVEAYDGESDLACHASKGRTDRTDVMYGEAGHAYVYLVYGVHCCLNVVTGPVGYPSAVLIRALEPREGTGWMEGGGGGGERVAAGPGRLTRALSVGLSQNRADLCAAGPLFIEEGEPVPGRLVARGPRIGVGYAGPWARKPWRYGVNGSPSLSVPFRKRRAALASGTS